MIVAVECECECNELECGVGVGLFGPAEERPDVSPTRPEGIPPRSDVINGG